MIGQNSAVSPLVAFTDDLRATKARLAEQERLASQPMVLVSPDGSRFVLVVDNSGNLSTDPA